MNNNVWSVTHKAVKLELIEIISVVPTGFNTHRKTFLFKWVINVCVSLSLSFSLLLSLPLVLLVSEPSPEIVAVLSPDQKLVSRRFPEFCLSSISKVLPLFLLAITSFHFLQKIQREVEVNQRQSVHTRRRRRSEGFSPFIYFPFIYYISLYINPFI